MTDTGTGGRQLPPARPTGTRSGVAEPVEHVGRQVDRLCWTGILLGLAFTMTNVQGFAAAGAHVWSLPWFAAWLLDPMVSLVLLAILRAEQITARHGVRTGGWVRTAKWFTLGATYVMNTWAAFAAGSPSLVVLHSVPPLVVFVAAEAVTDLRDKLAETVMVAFMNAQPDPRIMPQEATTEPPPRPRRARSASAKGRTSFADYLGHARQSWRPGVAITPAWVRQVTGCSRGLSSRLATALAEDVSDRADEDGQVQP